MNLLESRLPMEKLQALLSERFQIVFSDTSLLDTAFTHTSYANEHRLLKISHNERLEFFRRRCSSISYFRIFVQGTPKQTGGRFVQIPFYDCP